MIPSSTYKLFRNNSYNFKYIRVFVFSILFWSLILIYENRVENSFYGADLCIFIFMFFLPHKLEKKTGIPKPKQQSEYCDSQRSMTLTSWPRCP